MVIVEGTGQFWGEFGRSIVTSVDGDALCPNYFGGGLVNINDAVLTTRIRASCQERRCFQ